MSRSILIMFSCDWCKIEREPDDTNRNTTLPMGWHAMHAYGNGDEDHLCGACYDARVAALVETKNKRRAIAAMPPAPGQSDE